MRGLLFAAAAVAAVGVAGADDYSLAINNGRVIDPQSGLDAVWHLGIADGVIRELSDQPLAATTVLDASGLVVAPGFIDRNTYTLSHELFVARAADGVTTTFNLEEGAADVEAAYAALKGRALIHFGFSASWEAARIDVGDPGDLVLENGISQSYPSPELSARSLTDEELAAVLERIEAGLAAGAVAVGLGIEYHPGATHGEVLAVFELAAGYARSVQLHLRERDPTRDHQELYEAVAGAALTGGEIHISHLNSSGEDYVPSYLELLARARAAGLRVTAECYPYAAWMTDIRAAFLDGWRQWPDEEFGRYEWPATGERLTRESFGRYRESGGLVIGHQPTDAWADACVAHPATLIASDGGWDGGKTHPRVAGTNARVLGRYVREKGTLTLARAIAKMSLLPARSLEASVPAMARKGRIQEGMDADLVVFDAGSVIDRATFREPVLRPEGIRAVVVAGVVVIEEGAPVDGVYPGRAVRSPALGEPAGAPPG